MRKVSRDSVRLQHVRKSCLIKGMGSVDLDVLHLFIRTHFTVLRLLAMRVRRQTVLPLPPYRPPYPQAFRLPFPLSRKTRAESPGSSGYYIAMRRPLVTTMYPGHIVPRHICVCELRF